MLKRTKYYLWTLKLLPTTFVIATITYLSTTLKLIPCLTYSSTLKMEVICFFGMSAYCQ
jgi:hypothetical protein